MEFVNVYDRENPTSPMTKDDFQSITVLPNQVIYFIVPEEVNTDEVLWKINDIYETTTKGDDHTLSFKETEPYEWNEDGSYIVTANSLGYGNDFWAGKVYVYIE